MKRFKHVKSYEDLKNQYRVLLKENHPDNGGDPEAMKEINVEYDALFLIWKNRKEAEGYTLMKRLMVREASFIQNLAGRAAAMTGAAA